jgi:hypothetical protein
VTPTSTPRLRPTFRLSTEGLPADQFSRTHLEDQASDPAHKIQIDYTPMHHDPEEDQLRSAGAAGNAPIAVR